MTTTNDPVLPFMSSCYKIRACRNRYVRDLERRDPFICEESAQNRSLGNRKSTLSEHEILSRIWGACRAALAMSFGSHSCSSRSDFQRPTFHSFWWVGLLGCPLECGAIFGGYFFPSWRLFFGVGIAMQWNFTSNSWRGSVRLLQLFCGHVARGAI